MLTNTVRRSRLSALFILMTWAVVLPMAFQAPLAVSQTESLTAAAITAQIQAAVDALLPRPSRHRFKRQWMH